MGFGMQKWISNMKPKPMFGRRDRRVQNMPINSAGMMSEVYSI